jgi:uncharacterized membrane protein
MILTAWMFTGSKDVARAGGIDKLIALGPLLFAVPMAVFASQHFTQAKAVSTLVPRWLPGPLFWTYFIGAAIIAASLGIVVKKQARWAALLLGALLILFVVLLHVPNIKAEPKNLIAWAIALRDLAFSGGALAIAGSYAQRDGTHGAKLVITLARIFLAIAAIYYGAVHFFHPEFMPGIDFDRNVPAWIPMTRFWSHFAGACFLVTGAALLANWKARIAATWLGIAVLILILAVYLPIVISAPLDVDNGLNFMVSMVAFSGVALLVAEAVPKAPAG